MEIVVEYLKSQTAFHRYTKEEREETERVLLLSGRVSDYDVVAEFTTYEDADKFISDNYESIKEFGYFKNQKGELVLL